MVITRVTTKKSILTTVAPLCPVVGKNFGLSSTDTGTYIQKNELKVFSSVDGLLYWLIAGTRMGAQLFAMQSGDIATPVITTLRNRIASL